MVEKYLEAVIKGEDLRSSLLALKNELKTSEKEGTLTDALLILVRRHMPRLKELLRNEDPKVRQNAAACIAVAGEQDDLPAIIEAYKTDETNYNKAPYLKAIAYFDASAYRDIFEERMNLIMSEEHAPQDIKHLSEEIHELSSLLRALDHSTGKHAHDFIGDELINEVVLLTNRNFKNITCDELNGIPHKEFTAGVMAKTKHIKTVLRSRTFDELLFIPEGIRTCTNDPEAAAKAMIESRVPEYITERLSSNGQPYYFRVELRTQDIKYKTVFEKRFASAFEAGTGFRFINSTSDYELEFRFIEGNNNTINILLRFMGFTDDRFRYRKESISVGIKPYLAALCNSLAKPYLKENATVCDPFCGVGTMLVERDRLMPARMLYGIDIYGEAIRKASVNIAAAGLSDKTELITKDFFEFHHSHRFDEIITDFPFCTEQKSLRDIESLYRSFFKSLPALLEKENTIVIYSRNREFLRKYALSSGYKLLSEFEISKVEHTYLFVLTYSV